MDAAEFVVDPLMPFRPFPDRDSVTIGYAGVYSTFLLHAKRHAERFDLDPRDILMELGRRQAVAGQEDWILDVAVELAAAKRRRNHDRLTAASVWLDRPVGVVNPTEEAHRFLEGGHMAHRHHQGPRNWTLRPISARVGSISPEPSCFQTSAVAVIW